MHLFLDHGYENTTVQEITDLADVAKATFFNYFPTKEHVLATYHNEMTSEILQELHKLKTRRTEWIILSAMGIFAGWAERNKSMGRVILRTIFGSDVLMRADEKNEQRLFEWFRKQIENGIANGELRRDLDPVLLSSLIIGTLSASVQEWIMSDQAFGLKEALIEKVRFLFLLARVEGRTNRSVHLNRRKA
ncbi:MAG TPA: TetR/AcrR family transcriptional regulator [Acidobacteriota bacterium]|nr:TetR/AcrR family transcriptional regulator [Acidobacteriota bacterium]